MFHLWMARLGSVLTLVGALLFLLNILIADGIFIPTLFFSIYQNQAFVDGSLQVAFAAPVISYLCFLAGLVTLLLVQQSWSGRAASGIAIFGTLLTVLAHGLFIWPFTLGEGNELQMFYAYTTIGGWLTALG